MKKDNDDALNAKVLLKYCSNQNLKRKSKIMSITTKHAKCPLPPKDYGKPFWRPLLCAKASYKHTYDSVKVQYAFFVTEAN